MESEIQVPLLGKLVVPRFHMLLRMGQNDYRIKDSALYALALLGGASFLKFNLKYLWTIAQCFRPEKKQLTRRDGAEDFLAKYAVVLGGDTPIGQAFAHELASRRFNIIIVGGNKSVLESTTKEINDKHSVRATYMHTTAYLDEDIQTFLHDLEIHLKVNDIQLVVNAERILPSSQPFDQQGLDEVRRQILGHVTLPTVFMQACLKNFVLRESKGAVINITSNIVTGLSALQAPRPLYGATKSYLDYLSLALNKEYSSKGVNIHTVRHMLPADASSEDLAKFARNTMRWVGIKPVLHGGFVQAMKASVYTNTIF